MNATQKELAIATIDVFFDSVQLVVSLARFTIALGAITYEAAQASYDAGKATRIAVQPWIDQIICQVQSATAPATIPVISDPWEGEVEASPTANQVVSIPRLAPVTVAGYLAPGRDVDVIEAETIPNTPKTDAFKALVAESQANFGKMATITADLIQNKEAELEQDLADLGIKELRYLAKSKGIAKYSRKDKATLVKELATV